MNKIDLAAEQGWALDIALLRDRLGVSLVPTQAHRQLGLEELKQALLDAAAAANCRGWPRRFPKPSAARWRRSFSSPAKAARPPLPRYLVERLLLDVGGYLEQAQPPVADPPLLASVQAARQRLAEAGLPAPAVETISRYDWVIAVLDGVQTLAHARPRSLSDRLDAVLTHKLWGTLIFALLMVVVFQSIFAGAAPLMDLLDRAFGAVGDRISAAMPEGVLRSLIVDGLIAGVGGVLVFLAADPDLVFLHLAAGGMRLHGPGGVLDGSGHGPHRPERQVVHPAVVLVRAARCPASWPRGRSKTGATGW